MHFPRHLLPVSFQFAFCCLLFLVILCCLLVTHIYNFPLLVPVCHSTKMPLQWGTVLLFFWLLLVLFEQLTDHGSAPIRYFWVSSWPILNPGFLYAIHCVCHLLHHVFLPGLLFDTEDGGSTFCWYIGKILSGYTAVRGWNYTNPYIHGYKSIFLLLFKQSGTSTSRH